MPLSQSGVWSGFIPNVSEGNVYKYFIRSRLNQYQAEKADPFSFECEVPPKSGSVVQSLDYIWENQNWMAERKKFNNVKNQPVFHL